MFFRKHIYLTVTVIAALLAVTVWCLVPKEYAAQVKIADEYKETDLAVGLNKFNVMMRDLDDQNGNKGQNNISIYAKILDAADFAQEIATIQGVDDEHVQEHLCYNLHRKQKTLDIQYTDHDPVVAAQMLDTIVQHLQWRIWKYRGQLSNSAISNAEIQVESAEQALTEARDHYVKFAESHHNAVAPKVLAELNRLKAEVRAKENDRIAAYTTLTRQQSISTKEPEAFHIIKNTTIPHEPLGHIIGYVLVFVLIGLAIVKGSRLCSQRIQHHDIPQFGNLFSPWAITVFVWMFMGILAIGYGHNLYPLTERFYISIALWIPCFCLSSFITYNLLAPKEDIETHEGILINKWIFNCLFLLAIVMSPLCLYHVWKIVSLFDTKDLLTNVRTLANHGDGLGILKYGNIISVSLFLVGCWNYPHIKKWQIGIILLCCLINTAAIMEKGGIVVIFLCGAYVLYERGAIKLRSILLLSGVLLLCLYGFNLARQGFDTNYGQSETLFDFISMYVMSPPVAYCYQSPDLSTQFGANTFEVVYDILNRFGCQFEVHNKVQEFIWVPVSTNVYTMMQPFYLDFGYAGVAFFSCLYGVFSGWIYRLGKNGHALSLCLYTYLVQILAMQFFQDNLLLGLTGNVQLVILLVLLTTPIRIRRAAV